MRELIEQELELVSGGGRRGSETNNNVRVEANTKNNLEFSVSQSGASINITNGSSVEVRTGD